MDEHAGVGDTVLITGTGCASHGMKVLVTKLGGAPGVIYIRGAQPWDSTVRPNQYKIIHRASQQTDPNFDQRMREKTNDALRDFFT